MSEWLVCVLAATLLGFAYRNHVDGRHNYAAFQLGIAAALVLELTFGVWPVAS